jgi:hypothetical protein
MRDNHLLRRSRPLLSELALATVLLLGVGLVAVGASGAVAGVMGAAAGKAFVSGDAPGVTYTKARCAELREYAPHAPTCEAAAVEHHFGEVIWYRLAAGVLGGVVLAGYAWTRRRRGARGPALLPETLVPTAAATLFGAAAVFLLGQGLDLTFLGTQHGGGGFLSGGIVAAAVASWFARDVARTLVRRLPPATAATAAT